MLAHGDPIGCAVNPEVGRELRPLPQPSRRVRVVVVGAGPAGLEAACRAAELGHDVVLLEQSDRPGGALLVAALTPPLERLRRLVGWYERRLGSSGAELRTGTPATVESIASLEPGARRPRARRMVRALRPRRVRRVADVGDRGRADGPPLDARCPARAGPAGRCRRRPGRSRRCARLRARGRRGDAAEPRAARLRRERPRPACLSGPPRAGRRADPARSARSR